MARNPPASAGDRGQEFNPWSWKIHMLWSNQARVPQLLSPCSRGPRAATTEACLCSATREASTVSSPCLLTSVNNHFRISDYKFYNQKKRFYFWKRPSRKITNNLWLLKLHYSQPFFSLHIPEVSSYPSIIGTHWQTANALFSDLDTENTTCGFKLSNCLRTRSFWPQQLTMLLGQCKKKV